MDGLARLSPYTATQKRINGLMIGLFVVASLVIALSGVLPERAQHAEAVARAEDDLGDLARQVTSLAEHRLEQADNMLVGLRQLIEDRATSAQALPVIETLLQGALAQSDLHAVAVIDADGNWRAGFGAHPASFADMAHFRAQSTARDRALVLGNAEIDTATGKWIVPISRRLEDADGNFGGIVAAFFEPNRLLDRARITLGDGRAAALFAYDGGLLLARTPESGTDWNAAFILPTGDAARASAGAMMLRHTSSVDGIARVGTLVQGQRFPVSALVAQVDGAVSAGWWRDALLRMSGQILLAGLFFAGCLAGLARLREQQRVDNDRLARESEYRVLVEGAGDAVLRLRLDGRISFASAISNAVLGHAPDALMGNRLTDLVATENEPAVVAAIQGAASGANTRVSFFLAASNDCVPRRIIATMRLITGSANWSIIAVLRDETEGYRTERALASMAATDALTGLANRRTFMDRLNREWRRASREGQPLSLLFVDADNFKPFNDKYGHVAGDGCLKEIGAVIGGSSRRPGDVVARYGGEEFVLLLPRTDTAGAKHVAEQLRQAISALAIPHAGNPAGVVTASIGVATEIPGRDDSAPEILLANADGALYQAKADGRNAVRVFTPDETTGATGHLSLLTAAAKSA